MLFDLVTEAVIVADEDSTTDVKSCSPPTYPSSWYPATTYGLNVAEDAKILPCTGRMGHSYPVHGVAMRLYEWDCSFYLDSLDFLDYHRCHIFTRFVSVEHES